MFYFYKVAYVQYLGEVDIFRTWVKKFIPLYNRAKIIKSIEIFQSYDHKCTAIFYGSQCILSQHKSQELAVMMCH